MNPQQSDPSQFGNYSDWAKENLARGVSSDSLNQALQQQPQQNSGPKKSGDFWSTVGGVALPVLGALLAPETGGASLLASTALAGLGGVAGKAADNAAAGNNPIDSDLLGAGVTNAVGNLAGGALVKGAGALAKGVIKPAADKAAASLVQGQGHGALDKATADYLYRNGVTDLRQMGNIHPVVTGEGGAFTNAVNNTLLNAGDQGTRLDLSSLAGSGKGMPGSTVLSAVRDAGIAGESPKVNSVQQFVQGQLEKYNPDAIKSIPARKGGGVINSFDNGVLNAQHPIDALNMTKAMDAQAANWMKSATTREQGKALQNISNNIKDNLYGEGTSIGKTGVTDQVRQTAIDELAPLKEVNPTYYQNKVNELNNANTIGELRTAQKPEVIANQALEFAQNKANTSGGTNLPELFKVGAPVAGMSVGGPAGMAAGMIAPKVLGSNAANVAGAGTLSKLSSVIGNEKAGKVMDTLGRMGGVTLANVPSMGAEPINQSLMGGVSTNTQGETGMNQGQPSQLNSILDAMRAQAILAPEMNPGATSLLSSFLPQLQKNSMVQNAAQALPAEFGNAGGAQGLGGIGSVLSGFVPGTGANAYKGESAALAAQLGQALGISPEVAQNLLPTLLQSQQTAGQRQNVLGGIAGALPS